MLPVTMALVTRQIQAALPGSVTGSAASTVCRTTAMQALQCNLPGSEHAAML